MEKLLLIAVKLGRMEPQVISRARQTVLARLMESQIWRLSAGSMALPTFSVWEKAVPQPLL